MKRTRFIFIIILVLLITFPKDALATTYLRLSETDRYKTAIAVNKELFPTGPYSDLPIVIASGKDFPDALSGATLSCSILLTRGNILSEEVKNEIVRMGSSVIGILGGVAVISAYMETQLRDLGVQVERIQGQNRYETNVAIAEQVYNPKSAEAPAKIFIASGENFPDALSSATPAILEGAVILLVQKDKIPNPVKNYLNSIDKGIEYIYIIGGEGVISSSVEERLKSYTSSITRIGGVNRYDTSYLIAQTFFSNLPFQEESFLVFVSGENFPDALPSGLLATVSETPILLTQKNKLPTEIEKFVKKFDRQKVNTAYIVGGEAVVSEQVVNDIKETLQ